MRAMKTENPSKTKLSEEMDKWATRIKGATLYFVMMSGTMTRFFMFMDAPLRRATAKEEKIKIED